MASTPPRGDAAFVCVSGATPRWVRRRPLLLAGWFRLTNRLRRARLGWGVVGLLAVAALVWLLTRPVAASALVFAGDRWVLGFVVAAAHAATSVARRRPRLHAESESSWLAALPYRVSVSARIVFGFGVQLAALAVLCAGIAALGSADSASWPAANSASSLAAASPSPSADASTPWAAARATWLGVLAGYVVGGLAAWFAHALFPASGGGAQYAIVRRARENWAVAPSLQPLSYWPVAWARTLNNPQVSARTMLFVLLALPMGTTGAEALATAAGLMVGLYVLLNLVATVRTAFAAGWWLTPTPIRFAPFTRTLISRALLIQAGVFGAALVFIGAAGDARVLYLSLSATIAWLLLYTIITVLACAAARR